MPRAAKAYLHMWEEPCISGTKGSGTVFFSGCGLKCVYCQNSRISAENFGRDITVERLSEIFTELTAKGAHNINLVTAAAYVPHVTAALDIMENGAKIPVIYNSGGYENTGTIDMLKGYVNIFMPDIKYFDPIISEKYSAADDYFRAASKAVEKMIKTVGRPVFDSDGIMKSGVIIRHMVLPSHRRDSENILRYLAANYSADDFLLSVMSQYTPSYRSGEFKELNRRVSTYEYDKVTELAAQLGFKGYTQQRSSAKEEYTPEFDLYGI